MFNDIRVLGGTILTAVTLLGLLLAKAFAFSYAFILWPMLVVTVVFAIGCFIMSQANVG